MRKREVPAPNSRTVTRGTIRRSTIRDLGLLVRHRRGMWKDIAQFSKADLDVADRAYRHWARAQMKSNRFAGFIVDVDGQPVASRCTARSVRARKPSITTLIYEPRTDACS